MAGVPILAGGWSFGKHWSKSMTHKRLVKRLVEATQKSKGLTMYAGALGPAGFPEQVSMG